MADRMSEQPPYRGTIIVDTGSLYQLAAAIDDIFLDNSRNTIHHHFEILPFLAKQGFRIIIPETAAFDVGQTLRNGTCFNELFDNDRRATLHRVMASFLKSVVAGEHPGITIAEVTGPAEIVEKMRGIYRIHTGYVNEMTEKTGRGNTMSQRIRRAKASTGLHLTTLRDSFPPETSALFTQYLLNTTPPPHPVFVLSESLFGMDQYAKEHPEVGIINSSGLLKALKKSGLLTKELGFKPNAQVPEIMQNRRERAFELTGENRCSESVIDGKGAGFKDNGHSEPLFELLNDLAVEIGNWGPESAVLTPPPPIDPGRLARFSKKFGGTGWKERLMGSTTNKNGGHEKQ